MFKGYVNAELDKLMSNPEFTEVLLLDECAALSPSSLLGDRTCSSSFTGFQSLPSFNLLFKCFVNNLHSLQDCYFCF